MLGVRWMLVVYVGEALQEGGALMAAAKKERTIVVTILCGTSGRGIVGGHGSVERELTRDPTGKEMERACEKAAAAFVDELRRLQSAGGTITAFGKRVAAQDRNKALGKTPSTDSKAAVAWRGLEVARLHNPTAVRKELAA